MMIDDPSNTFFPVTFRCFPNRDLCTSTTVYASWIISCQQYAARYASTVIHVPQRDASWPTSPSNCVQQSRRNLSICTMPQLSDPAPNLRVLLLADHASRSWAGCGRDEEVCPVNRKEGKDDDLGLLQ